MAATFYSFSPFFALLQLFFSFQISVHSFSVDLIHRDSPQSPFYNPSATRSERLNIAFHRSISRAAHFSKTTKPTDAIESRISPSGGAYLMKLSIGTPPFPIFGIADTGSDLTWAQCKPCNDCYTQISPYFDPKKSSTFRKLSCNNEACLDVGTSACVGRGNFCQYTMVYGDSSHSTGDLASETFTFGSTSGKNISIPKLFFGCGHDNAGTFNETANGIIGLGGGAVSIIRKLGDTINGKFSYCLVPMFSDANVTSKISFGESADVSGSDVVSTPLIKKSVDTFYYITLESILVGNKTLPYKNSNSKASSAGDVEEGNMIIDSGTTLTFVSSEFYEDIESELKRAIKGKPQPDPKGDFGLCYAVADNIDVPKITFSFTGAELELSGNSTFVQISNDLMCFTIVPSEDIAIFGNLSQMNFLVGYDLVKNKLSFKPTDCTKN